MSCPMSPKRLEGLLSDVVVKYVYSIPPQYWRSILNDPPSDEEALAESIVAAERHADSAPRKGRGYHLVLEVVRRHWELAVRKQAT